MPVNWPPKVSPTKRWRVRGKAADGLVVTLGRYETAEQAHADCKRLEAQAEYRDLTVQPIEPKPDVGAAGKAPD